MIIVKRVCLIVFLFVLQIACNPDSKNNSLKKKAIPVTISQEDSTFQLYRAGDPYFIKGARTLRTRYMEKVAEYGGNSIRIGYHENVKEVLDEADSIGLSVMFGLPFRSERAGFDYNDQKAIDQQQDSMKQIVEAYKGHPAILLWAIGNELDHVPGQETYNLNMWNAVNEVAKMIHEVDPAHPAMTVIGTGRKHKLADLIERCPDLDLLGVNAYADIGEIPGWLRKYNWSKPYAVTEWGPSGHWQVPQTQWGVVIEETSTEKADLYRQRYENVIAADPWCVGSYVFLWTSNRQERTHTWYNMFHDDGTEKEAVEVMNFVWTGEWPENKAPRIESLKINGLNGIENVNLPPSSEQSASVEVYDPDQDTLRIVWELVPENTEFGAYAGQGETKPEPVKDFVIDQKSSGKKISFTTPPSSGDDYRLFVYIYDGHENIAAANIPFHIKE